MTTDWQKRTDERLDAIERHLGLSQPSSSNPFVTNPIHVSTWQAGRGFGAPDRVRRLIAQGIPYRFTLPVPDPSNRGQHSDMDRYEEVNPECLLMAAECSMHGWPFDVVIGNSSAKNMFLSDRKYDPVFSDDTRQYLSPMGPLELWEHAGHQLGSQEFWKWLPPKFRLLDNNEAKQITHGDEGPRSWRNDVRLVATYSGIQDKWTALQLIWLLRSQQWRAFWDAFREACPCNPEIIGYGMGNHKLRLHTGLHGYQWSRGAGWDGASHNYYTDKEHDYQIDSLQGTLSSNYTLDQWAGWITEASVWVHKGLGNKIPEYTPLRWRGVVGFITFLHQPSVVRHFHAWDQTTDKEWTNGTQVQDWQEADLLAVAAMNQHGDWRNSRLIPSETNRWPSRMWGSGDTDWQIPGPLEHPCYLLSCSANPHPDTYEQYGRTTYPVFACAREKAGRRLTYAHAPYGPVDTEIEGITGTVAVPQEGIYLES